MFPPHWSLSNTPPEVSLLLGPVRPLVVRAVGRRLGRLVGGHVGRHPAARPGAGHALTNQSLVLELREDQSQLSITWASRSIRM